jgi:hypothetical protein
MQRYGVCAIVAIGAILLFAAPAEAQSNFTFVSGSGLDTNPCSLQAPCRSFAAAVLVTNPGGQVTMLDPAGYGTVTITKAISIVNDGGGEAGINAPGASQDAITINAGAGDVVNLRGLTLNGVGTGRNGISFNHGGALNIQNCVIRGFALTAVLAQPTTSAAVTIADTIVSNNNEGIVINALGGTQTAYIERTVAIGNPSGGIGLDAAVSATLRGTIVDSVATGASGASGFAVGGAGATVTLINSKAINNFTGLNVGSGATMYISETTVAGNSADGFLNNAASLQTFSDNYIIDTTNSGSLTPIAEQ